MVILLPLFTTSTHWRNALEKKMREILAILYNVFRIYEYTFTYYESRKRKKLEF